MTSQLVNELRDEIEKLRTENKSLYKELKLERDLNDFFREHVHILADLLVIQEQKNAKLRERVTELGWALLRRTPTKDNQ